MTASDTPNSAVEQKHAEGLDVASTVYQALAPRDADRVFTLCDVRGRLIVGHDLRPDQSDPVERCLEAFRPPEGRAEAMTQKINAARQRLVMIRLMIDAMRSLHGAYAPTQEPFGTRLETFFVGFCVALGDIEGKPFSASKIAAYLHMPRTTVMRRLKRLENWDIVYRHGRRYHIRDTMLNSLVGMRSYLQIRRMISRAGEELTVLDTLPD
jgi:hypothetical protein